MQCKCGGEATTTSQVSKKLKAEIEYYLCKACEMVSSSSLYIDGLLVCRDPEARANWAILDKERVEALYAAALEASSPTPSATTAPPLPTESLGFDF